MFLIPAGARIDTFEAVALNTRGQVCRDRLIHLFIESGNFRGLSEEVDTVKEVEQQLLLYNIFVDHQLSLYQVCKFDM